MMKKTGAILIIAAIIAAVALAMTISPGTIGAEQEAVTPDPETETSIEPTAEPTNKDTEEPQRSHSRGPAEPRTYNGISEGETIIGELTHYCICLHCCGKIDGITASGLKLQNGIEPETPVAACNWLPFGTIIEIDGKEHVIADRGGSSLNEAGRLDIFTPEGHEAALELGRIYGAEIRIVSLPETEEGNNGHD